MSEETNLDPKNNTSRARRAAKDLLFIIGGSLLGIAVASAIYRTTETAEWNDAESQLHELHGPNAIVVKTREGDFGAVKPYKK